MNNFRRYELFHEICVRCFCAPPRGMATYFTTCGKQKKIHWPHKQFSGRANNILQSIGRAYTKEKNKKIGKICYIANLWIVSLASPSSSCSSFINSLNIFNANLLFVSAFIWPHLVFPDAMRL